ncbi:lipoate--protein ligase family protein [Luteolibacter sp. Populi]|uniref:lipoyl protein ligase domain-containing protein n=1 Tax=Luteolibacter sp. Populi TaxID=3230487 RepID=UPI003465C02D
MLPQLQLWIDPTPRDGPENMAVDEWLAESCDLPVLRSYTWQPGWGSFGYFVKRAELPENGLRWVRRWTGGGIVDHRADWTYTLFVPRGFGLAEARGAESYRLIHGALAAAMGGAARLAAAGPSAVGGECFIQPVEHDILDPAGRKIAGAGQRRTVRGLLHQGSVAGGESFAQALAAGLSGKVGMTAFHPPPELLAEKASGRYASEAWMNRR